MRPEIYALCFSVINKAVFFLPKKAVMHLKAEKKFFCLHFVGCIILFQCAAKDKVNAFIPLAIGDTNDKEPLLHLII